jgi:hypothetical protein
MQANLVSLQPDMDDRRHKRWTGDLERLAVSLGCFGKEMSIDGLDGGLPSVHPAVAVRFVSSLSSSRLEREREHSTERPVHKRFGFILQPAFSRRLPCFLVHFVILLLTLYCSTIRAWIFQSLLAQT